MKKNLQTILGVAAMGTLLSTPTALAMNNYIFGAIGISSLSDSDNSGRFTDDFLTGNADPDIPFETNLPDGTPVSWSTEFDNGTTFSVGYGRKYTNNIRAELEFSYSANDVDTHSGVEALGIDLTDIDAAVLLTGLDTNLGATVGEVVAAGRGDIASRYLMLNGVYDFDTKSPVTPYVGVGVGIAMVDVSFNPSGVVIIEDDDSGFAYQLLAGLSWTMSEKTDLYVGYKYRASNDIESKVSLFPATLEVENQASILEVGMRVNF
jgi:opacity protein-like surface antigen